MTTDERATRIMAALIQSDNKIDPQDAATKALDYSKALEQELGRRAKDGTLHG